MVAIFMLPTIIISGQDKELFFWLLEEVNRMKPLAGRNKIYLNTNMRQFIDLCFQSKLIKMTKVLIADYPDSLNELMADGEYREFIKSELDSGEYENPEEWMAVLGIDDLEKWVNEAEY